MCRKITFCEKHNIERSIKKRSNRSDEYYCIKCKNERARERKYILNINNPDWVAKQNYKNNLTEEDKKLKLKEYIRNYQKTEKRRDYNIVNLKCKESNLYCIQCNTNRVYGKKNCDNCKLHNKWIQQNNFTSTCLHCNNKFDIETKLLNKGKVDKINIFCSLQCSKDSIKHNYITRYNNFKNNKEKLNRKRELERIYSVKRRIENPDVLKQAQEKYHNSEKYRDYKISKLSITSSNIYCIRCNNNRVYNDNYCNDCSKLLHIINNHDYISICKHCNKEYGLDVKISNSGKVFQLNRYCSVECNNDSKKENYINYKKEYKKTEAFKKMQSERKRNGTFRKRVVKSGNKYEFIIRRVLFQRFNYICQGCNVKCVHPNDINYNQDNCATIDHIKPISKGGSHTYNNTQLLCRKCNWMKRDNENYFEHKQRAKQMELQFDLTMVKHGTGEQLALFEQGHGA